MCKTNNFLAKRLDVSSRLIKDYSFIYSETKKELIKLNKVGSYIWEQINGSVTINNIIDNCKKKYSGTDEEISESVLDFVNLLASEDLIDYSDNKFEGLMISD